MTRTAAVVGAGTIARMHLAPIAALADVELVGVCDTDAPRAAEAAATYGTQAFTDRRTLLAEARPDVVHLCLSHDQHLPVALDALAAGAHVLTEKPLAPTLLDAQRFHDAAQQAAARGQQVGVCYQNRYNDTSLALRQALESGSYGRPLGARASVWWHRDARYYRAAPWRGRWETAGGGTLINQAIHTLDLLLWLLGDATSVAGWAAHADPETAAAGVEIEDTAHVTLTHTSGVTSALVATNRHWTDAPVMLEVGTEQGLLRLADGALHHHRPEGRSSCWRRTRPPTAARATGAPRTVG
ncbi:Gfo/Idh/MocA family oxidoreductase [Arsenicicoccus piscis]|uniref:Dehydrogenase n=1 Tax=Arsenicicoccus piscis TaxID=673954 RepID=A0ABQ6HKR1_9MICO|nr:Gfo/Idh/MocA family oxidoreductase [Arsenicicoccus piscis]MCH8627272.1 Gfo/Idh/MocA family oxidoreductase [Arsenicicoccus piscis]GMA18742.1 dehydrogenase [Arsenicicoccus piscis]